MATLAEQLAELEPKLASLQRANEEVAVLKAPRVRSQQVSVSRKALEESLSVFGRVGRLGASTTGRPRASAPLRGKPGALRERLEKNLDEVVLDSQWDATLLAPLGQFSEKLADWTREAWTSLVDQHAQPVRDEILDQFDRLGFGSRVQEVRAARDRIKVLRGQLPADDSALSTVGGLAESIAKELGALKTVPIAVRAFFAKAAVREAALEDLTVEVQDWLRANDLLKMLRIGFK
jgi:hypothetical protein